MKSRDQIPKDLTEKIIKYLFSQEICFVSVEEGDIEDIKPGLEKLITEELSIILSF